MQKAIIIGATSGIGQEVARILVQQGWHIGIAGRREEALHALQATAPDRIVTEQLDVTEETATLHLHNLIKKLGGIDLFFLSSGVGHQNRDLQPDIELNTARTNVEGFTRMVTAAFNYFKEKGSGHIAVISSIAGTKGLGVAPAYSATKRFQNTYIEALAQLARMQHLDIHFTDIRPGFVATDLLKSGKYPMLMKADRVAQHIIKALREKRRVVVIDGRYRVLVFFLAYDSTMAMGKVAYNELISYLHVSKQKYTYRHEEKFKIYRAYRCHCTVRRFQPPLPRRQQYAESRTRFREIRSSLLRDLPQRTGQDHFCRTSY